MEALDELIETFVEWCPPSATYTDQYGYTPLHYALYNSPRYKTVRVLLQKMDKGKAYLTGDTRSSLLLEAGRNNCSWEIIRLLMRQTPFATIIPDLIPQKNAEVPYNVQCFPIETLFKYEDTDEDIEYRDVRNEMKHIMCFSFHCFLQMMINETEGRSYSISQKAAESLKEQADWMIQMICLNDTKEISN
jgi:hypothetical protein